MNRTDISHRPLDKGFGAIKKTVARFMGIKRLEDGCDFQESASATDPFVGEREHNMGDLWREPSDNQSSAESEPSHSDISRSPYETDSFEER